MNNPMSGDTFIGYRVIRLRGDIGVVRIHFGTMSAVFACGGFWSRMYLRTRGYRSHQTTLGPVMAKWWAR